MNEERLPSPDHFYLEAARGWLMLGNAVEALHEIGGLSPQFAEHPDVLEVAWQIHARDKKWLECLEIGRKLTEIAPARGFGWIHFANTLYFLGRTQEAYDTLKPKLGLFPKNESLPYNLACYACQLGRHDEARDWLEKAMALGQKAQVKEYALQDPDLTPIREHILKA